MDSGLPSAVHSALRLVLATRLIGDHRISYFQAIRLVGAAVDALLERRDALRANFGNVCEVCSQGLNFAVSAGQAEGVFPVDGVRAGCASGAFGLRGFGCCIRNAIRLRINGKLDCGVYLHGQTPESPFADLSSFKSAAFLVPIGEISENFNGAFCYGATH
jgi:hypothetical protein